MTALTALIIYTLTMTALALFLARFIHHGGREMPTPTGHATGQDTTPEHHGRHRKGCTSDPAVIAATRARIEALRDELRHDRAQELGANAAGDL